MALVLDAPTSRDVTLFEDAGLKIVSTKFDWNRLGDVRIEWIGDEADGMVVARPVHGGSCSLD